MRLTKILHILSPLLMMGLLIGLNGCGSAPSGSAKPPSGNPDRVQIEVDRHTSPPLTKPVLNLTVTSMVQQLYTTIYALPQMPENIACTDELGPHYTLTFYQGQKKLTTVIAADDGCRQITLSGEQHDRTAMNNKSFWNQLDSAIYEATPTAIIGWTSLMSTPSSIQPPRTARITTASTAQRLYNAILALPIETKNNSYVNGSGDYQMIFHTKDQTISATVDSKQKLVTLGGQYQSRGGAYRMNDQFQQLFTKTLAGVTFKPAHPDTLFIDINTNQTSGHLTVKDLTLTQKLYSRIFTFPTAQPPPDNCTGNDKVAGKSKWHELTFLQWDLTLLRVSAYEGSCTFVTRDSDSGQSQYLQADEQFWTLLHQAIKQ